MARGQAALDSVVYNAVAEFLRFAKLQKSEVRDAGSRFGASVQPPGLAQREFEVECAKRGVSLSWADVRRASQTDVAHS